jgi:tetratricopeptide (TPR) repeat protein
MKTSISILFVSILISCTKTRNENAAELLSIATRLREQGNWEQTIRLCDVAQKMTDDKDDEWEASFLIEEGRAYLLQERTENARASFQKAFDLVKTSATSLTGKTYYEIGNLLYIDWAYRGSSTLDSSLVCLRSALHLAKINNDTFLLNTCMYRIGAIHQIKENRDSSQHYFHNALELAMSVNDTLGMARSYTHLAEELKVENKIEESARFDSTAIMLARKKKALYSLCFYLTNLAETYSTMGRNQEALDLLSESIHIGELLKNGLVLGRNYLLAGQLHTSNNPSLALSYYKKAKQTGESKGYKFYAQAAGDAIKKIEAKSFANGTK